MLTKEHLNFKIKNGRAVPQFLDPGDALATGLAEDLLTVFRDGEGSRVGELEAAAEEVADGDLAAAFRKLLLDACATEEDDGEVADFRWQCLLKAQELRRRVPALSPAEFQAAVGAPGDRLYADLPACRKVRSFKDMDSSGLVQRYNCAQVQGLLLRARSVTIRLKGAALSDRRELFRQMKFHRLMGAVTQTEGKKGGIEVTLSGPLTLFDQAATYGMRLANFFPRILHLADWQIEAEIHVKNRDLSLKLDASAGLVSHYAARRPYIPEELTALVDGFNERMSPAWRIESATEFVHIGSESYCFPDLTIYGQNGRTLHIELFHRWHAAPLSGRLQALEKHPDSELFLGVSKNLAKNPELDETLKASRVFVKWGFLFSEFPTHKTISELLVRNSSGQRSYGKVK